MYKIVVGQQCKVTNPHLPIPDMDLTVADRFLISKRLQRIQALQQKQKVSLSRSEPSLNAFCEVSGVVLQTALRVDCLAVNPPPSMTVTVPPSPTVLVEFLKLVILRGRRRVGSSAATFYERDSFPCLYSSPTSRLVDICESGNNRDHRRYVGSINTPLTMIVSEYKGVITGPALSSVDLHSVRGQLRSSRGHAIASLFERDNIGADDILTRTS